MKNPSVLLDNDGEFTEQPKNPESIISFKTGNKPNKSRESD